MCCLIIDFLMKTLLSAHKRMFDCLEVPSLILSVITSLKDINPVKPVSQQQYFSFAQVSITNVLVIHM